MFREIEAFISIITAKILHRVNAKTVQSKLNFPKFRLNDKVFQTFRVHESHTKMDDDNKIVRLVNRQILRTILESNTQINIHFGSITSEFYFVKISYCYDFIYSGWDDPILSVWWCHNVWWLFTTAHLNPFEFFQS